MSDYWIQTYTGKRFDLLEPTPEMVELADIAHALSMLCRFTGHTKFFYSVAEHSYQVSVLVESYCRRIGMSAKDGAHAGLEALLHDAAEAYVGDVSRPLKWLLRNARETSSFDVIEKRVEQAVWKRFFYPMAALPAMLNRDLVKKVDAHMLAVEARQVLDGGPQYTWGNNNGDVAYDPDFAVPHLSCLPSETARRMFVMRANELQDVIAGRV